MSDERKEQLKAVFDFAVLDKKCEYGKTEICRACGIENLSSIGVIIDAARNGKTFEEGLLEYSCPKRYKTKSPRKRIGLFSDIELKEELIRRGWEVTCKRTTIEEL